LSRREDQGEGIPSVLVVLVAGQSGEWRSRTAATVAGTPGLQRADAAPELVASTLGPRWLLDRAETSEFFTFWPFFRKFLSNRPLAERIPEMDPWLGARVSGAELGATVTGAELLATGKRPARGSAPERMAPSSAP